MNPEFYEYISEKIFKKGALDVYLTSIMMKKGRPGIKLTVLSKEENLKNIKEIILKETTTLGIREYKTKRDILERKFTKVKTEYGTVNIKNSYLGGKLIKSKPEYDDCKRLAIQNDVEIKKIYEQARRAVES